MNAAQQQERDFMISRQTLGRPGDSLNGRAVQGGATIVTQFNRDNLDDDAAVPDQNDIDDLRRE